MTNQPTRFRRLPLEVEARQLLASDDGQAARDLAIWCDGWVAGTYDEPKVMVPTLEGHLAARTGDWIVQGQRGEFWPVRGDIFAETYEPVRPAPSMTVAEAEAALAPLEDAVRADRHAQQDAETEEQRADREETERDHARGDHTHCGITCEVELPTEHLRNFVIAKGYPGTKGALDELLRRATNQAAVRAAALREAAAALTPHLGTAGEAEDGEMHDATILWAANLLRRLADEQPAPTTQPDDDQALHAKLDEATATLRRIRSVIKDWESCTLPHSQAHRLFIQVRDGLAGPRPDPDEPAGPAAPTKEA